MATLDEQQQIIDIIGNCKRRINSECETIDSTKNTMIIEASNAGLGKAFQLRKSQIVSQARDQKLIIAQAAIKECIREVDAIDHELALQATARFVTMLIQM